MALLQVEDEGWGGEGTGHALSVAIQSDSAIVLFLISLFFLFLFSFSLSLPPFLPPSLSLSSPGKLRYGTEAVPTTSINGTHDVATRSSAAFTSTRRR